MMNKNELKRLSRADLLEMLIVKCRENEQLRAELEETKKLVGERPAPEPVAAADSQISAVFQAMKLAAEQYFENVRKVAEEDAK